MTLRVRTLVINIAYDDTCVKDPTQWVGQTLHPLRPHHYGVLSVMAPQPYTQVLPTADMELVEFRPECVMHTDIIRDIRGNRI